jgi:sec-independent protein translocase protein TatB
MFDIGWSEMLVIVIVLIVVVGPKDLPKVMRMAGRWAAKARNMAAEFQNSLQDMAREAELDDVQREIKSIAKTDVKTILRDTVDPTGEMANQMQVDLPDLNPERAFNTPAGDKSPSDTQGDTPAVEAPKTETTTESAPAESADADKPAEKSPGA